MEGYLSCHISGQLLSHEYYFIRHEDTLIYCRKKGDVKLGQIHLGICEILRTSQMQIQIKTGCNTIQLRGTPHALDQWEKNLTAKQQEQETMESLTDELAKIKSIYSQFDEMLRQLTQKLEGNPALAASAEVLEGQISEWLGLMDTERKGAQIDSEFQSCIEHQDTPNVPSVASLGDLKDLLEHQPNKYNYLDNCLPYDDFQFTNNPLRAPIVRQGRGPLILNKWSELKHQLYATNLVVPSCANTHIDSLFDGMLYTTLLEQADSMNESCLRLAHVVGFTLAQFSHLWNEFLVPFQSQQSETFDFEQGFKFIAEQTTSQCSAIKCFSEKFSIQAQIEWSWSFVGAVMTIEPRIKCEISLNKNKDQIKIQFINFAIQIYNLITQKPYIQITGKILFTNTATNDQAEVEYMNQLGSLNLVSGTIQKEDQIRYTISGQWHKSVSVFHKLTHDEMIIFRKLQDSMTGKLHQYLEFELQLNHLHQQNLVKLPLTDSRFRGDVRALETSNYDLAFKENKKIRDHKPNEIGPLWFTKNEQNIYSFNEKYYKVKNQDRFVDQLTIF